MVDVSVHREKSQWKTESKKDGSKKDGKKHTNYKTAKRCTWWMQDTNYLLPRSHTQTENTCEAASKTARSIQITKQITKQQKDAHGGCKSTEITMEKRKPKKQNKLRTWLI